MNKIEFYIGGMFFYVVWIIVRILTSIIFDGQGSGAGFFGMFILMFAPHLIFAGFAITTFVLLLTKG